MARSACLFLLLLVAGPGCARNKPAVDDASKAPAVEIAQARAGTLPLEEQLSGVARSRNQVTVRPEISAVVAEVFMRSGESVKKGDPLVRLRDDGLRDQLRQAEASVALQQATAKVNGARVAELQAQVGRARALAEQQLISRLELETLEAQLLAARAGAEEAAARVDQARATVDERRSALDKTLVRAPISGSLGRRQAEVGMLATTETALFEIGNLERLIIEVPLTGEMLAHLREGQPVRVAAPGLARPIEARLTRIPRFLAPGNFSTLAEIDVANPDGGLTAGAFATVHVLYGETRKATVLPTSALFEDTGTGSASVFVAQYTGREPTDATGIGVLSDRATPVAQRAVEVLAEGRGQVGVTGVEAGEWVVTIGQHLLAEGPDAVARVRPTSLARVLDLQTRQREGVLDGFLAKQQRLARTRGAIPPGNEEFMGSAAPSPAAGRAEK